MSPDVKHACARSDAHAVKRVGELSGRDHGGCAAAHYERALALAVDCSAARLAVPPEAAKALEAAQTARLPRSYWDWQAMTLDNQAGFFPYTPATNLLYGLRESLRMLFEEGLDRVFSRHLRHAEATRRALEDPAAASWGEAARARATALFTPAAHARGLVAVYEAAARATG